MWLFPETLWLSTRLRIYKLGMFRIKDRKFSFWYGQVSSYKVDSQDSNQTLGKIKTNSKQKLVGCPGKEQKLVYSRAELTLRKMTRIGCFCFYVFFHLRA